MRIEKSLDEAGQVDRGLNHRKVAAIRDEGERRVLEPGPQSPSQMVFLETGKILSATDYQQRRANVSLAHL